MISFMFFSTLKSLAWQDRNPDYWRSYRETHPEYAERNRNRQRQQPAGGPMGEVAKMDMSALPSGLYRIRTVTAAEHASGGTWVVEITPVCLDCPCKKDSCKERT